MTNEERDEIMRISRKADWLVSPKQDVFTHRIYPNLKIREKRRTRPMEFEEGWMKCFAIRTGYRAEYALYDGSRKIRDYTLVSVDGGGALLPIPYSAEELRVTVAEVNFARIVDTGYQFEEYLRRAGFEITLK